MSAIIWEDVLAAAGPHICHFHDERSQPILISNPLKKLIMSLIKFFSIGSALWLCKVYEMISFKNQIVFVVQAVQ